MRAVHLNMLSFYLLLITALSITNSGSVPETPVVPGVHGLLSEIGRGSFSFAFQSKSLLCEAALLQYLLLITSFLYTAKLSHVCGFLQGSEKLTLRY